MGQNYGSGIAAVGLMKAPPAAAGGGSQTVTIFDDFSTDTDAHYDYWDSGTETGSCTVSSGVMTLDCVGGCMCHPLSTSGGTPPGNQPSTFDHWAIWRTPATGVDFKRGPAIRVRDDGTEPTGTEFQYDARCRGNVGDTIVIQVCDTGSSCATIESTGIACNTVSDTIGLMAAGDTTDTEICLWFWETGGPTIDASTTPDSWGADADYCISSDGSIDNSKLTGMVTCGGSPTTCSTWDTAPNTAKGWAANTNFSVTLYGGAAGAFDVDAWAAGDL